MKPFDDISLAVLIGAIFAPVMLSAQVMAPIVDLCQDPVTSGTMKIEALPRLGWTASQHDPDALLALATALVIGFTNGIPDLEDRFSKAPVLVENFENLMQDGQVTLWKNGDAILAVSIAETPEGGEHLACYFASPKTDETLQQIAKYGEPELLPELELIAYRFDETVFTLNPDIEYKMFSSWTRLTSPPARGPLLMGFVWNALKCCLPNDPNTIYGVLA